MDYQKYSKQNKAGMVQLLISKLKKLRHQFVYRQYADNRIDSKYHIDTSDYIDFETFDVSDSSKKHGHDYEPTSSRAFNEMMDAIPDDVRDSTFIDFGTGLGRALFLAMELGFRRIIGIEISKELVEKGRANLAACRQHNPDIPDIDMIELDAADYEIPLNDCVLYFFNPFDEIIMGKMAANILKSFGKKPRKIYIIYYNPWYTSIFDNNQRFHCLARAAEKRDLIGRVRYAYTVYRVGA